MVAFYRHRNYKNNLVSNLQSVLLYKYKDNTKGIYKMKKLLTILFIAFASIAFAHGPAPMHRPHYAYHAPVVHYHRHHNHSFWGRGGSNFWPGFIGGIIGSTIVNTTPIVQRPVVVQQPVIQQPVVVQPSVVVQQPVIQQPVLIPARRVISGYDSFGRPIYVDVPAHYEYR